jgi:hypothetical protein
MVILYLSYSTTLYIYIYRERRVASPNQGSSQLFPNILWRSYLMRLSWFWCPNRRFTISIMNSGPFQQSPKVNQTTWCRASCVFKVQKTTTCSKFCLFGCLDVNEIWFLQHTLFNTLSFRQVYSCWGKKLSFLLVVGLKYVRIYQEY